LDPFTWSLAALSLLARYGGACGFVSQQQDRLCRSSGGAVENTRRLSELGSAHNAFQAVHDRLTDFMAKTNFEMISLHVIGAVVLLEIIFSLHTSW
jgi:hypothetical protein